MEATTVRKAARHVRRARTVEELLRAEQARALAGLTCSIEGLGTELSEALGRSPAARHPLLAGSVALLLGLAGAPGLARGFGRAMSVFGSAADRALALAALALGMSRRRLW